MGAAGNVDREAFQQALRNAGGHAWVAASLAGICVLVFAAMCATGMPVVSPHGSELIAWGSNYGPLALRGEPWRLATSLFLHFGVVHLAINCWALLDLGRLAERLLGSGRFAMLYAASGVCASMTSLLWNPMVNGAGATGALFGVIGALLAAMLNPRLRMPGAVAWRHACSAVALVASSALAGLMHRGVDVAAHLGGLGCGFLLGWHFVRPLSGWERRPAASPLLPGVVAGAAILMVFGALLFRPGEALAARRAQDFAFADVLDAELAAVARERELQAAPASGTNEDAQRVLAELGPVWQGLIEAVRRLPEGRTPPQVELRQLLGDYAEGQLLIAQLRAEGEREADTYKLDWARDVTAHQQLRVLATRALIDRL